MFYHYPTSNISKAYVPAAQKLPRAPGPGRAQLPITGSPFGHSNGQAHGPPANPNNPNPQKKMVKQQKRKEKCSRFLLRAHTFLLPAHPESAHPNPRARPPQPPPPPPQSLLPPRFAGSLRPLRLTAPPSTTGGAATPHSPLVPGRWCGVERGSSRSRVSAR